MCVCVCVRKSSKCWAISPGPDRCICILLRERETRGPLSRSKESLPFFSKRERRGREKEGEESERDEREEGKREGRESERRG